MVNRNKKSLDFEINLLPVISVLAVCISFLLLTTVWVRVGTFDLNQALGTETKADTEKSPTVMVTFDNAGKLLISVKNAPSVEARLRLSSIEFQTDKIERLFGQIKAQAPELHTALVMPAPHTEYDRIIRVMDALKKMNITNLGIAPL